MTTIHLLDLLCARPIQSAVRIGLSLVLLAPVSLVAQGSLTPSGPPAPSMKTLDQVEPRTNLQGAAAAGVDSSNANYQFTITQPGSYYLSGNIAVSKPNGILITCEGVSIDLNGFEIARTSGTGGNGIEIANGANHSTLHHGSIHGFAKGVETLLGSARGSAFRELSVSGCTVAGLVAGSGAVIESCRLHDNSGSYGIIAGSGATISNCTASNNTTQYAIFATAGGTLTNCAVFKNVGDYGIAANAGTLLNCSASANTVQFGIFAGPGSSVTNCTANGNTCPTAASAGFYIDGSASHCTSSQNVSSAAALTSNSGVGFVVAPNSAVTDCTATLNRGDGIRTGSSTVIRRNHCSANGSGGDGAGVHATGSRNRIEANEALGAGRGIEVDTADNVIIGNTAGGNTTNYKLVANNIFGAIVDRTAAVSAVVVGNSAAASAGTTDPWANIAQ